MDGTGVRILVEGWDGAPFYQVLVAAVASEGEALLAAACHLTRGGARLVSHDPEETTWVDLASLPACCRVEPPSPEGVLFESGRLWAEAHFAPRRTCPLLDGVRPRGAWKDGGAGGG